MTPPTPPTPRTASTPPTPSPSPLPDFRELHHQKLPLVLPNAWDIASALAFAGAGFAAVGTTSFGVASGLGRPDGGRSTREASLALARALAPLPVHVSVDIEDGYADDPDEVAAYVAALTAEGVVGVNIEDSTAETLIDPAAHAAKVAAVKRRCPEVFVNARADTYWLGQDATVRATLERAARYVEAGADGVFVPGATDPAVLRELTSAVPVPLNVLAIPGRSPAELAEWGVRRVSTGSLPYRAALHAAVAVAEAVRGGGDVPAATPYPDLQARPADHASRSGHPRG
ncbi:isocitrate lyase/phosphoenolpyruvate mutase family protein [Streptomyces sp. NBC_01498]|uniref:isocitrate lyase/PEP mutase family protein n=1 Tax=Streptomyces sp. NBC_01498 TaxID=2975870 RepID=UPI002E7AB9C0|nr:isocitrate lyase/phosphoenolpyruvate mutase family protein [Streptomyces sp. NBC_01498]WTL25722.1 isocitrate lyase/phosphoenolpyruvate mutase family protein [Streptomyces sp. NBC_01498]